MMADLNHRVSQILVCHLRDSEAKASDSSLLNLLMRIVCTWILPSSKKMKSACSQSASSFPNGNQ